MKKKTKETIINVVAVLLLVGAGAGIINTINSSNHNSNDSKKEEAISYTFDAETFVTGPNGFNISESGYVEWLDGSATFEMEITDDLFDYKGLTFEVYADLKVEAQEPGNLSMHFRLGGSPDVQIEESTNTEVICNDGAFHETYLGKVSLGSSENAIVNITGLTTYQTVAIDTITFKLSDVPVKERKRTISNFDESIYINDGILDDGLNWSELK